MSPYEPLGCWDDRNSRALTPIDADIAQEHGPYKTRSDPIQNCFEEAKAGGYEFFAVQDGGYCFASSDPDAYKKYGSSSLCWDGKGGQMTNNVYRIRNGNFDVISCSTN